VVRDECDFSVIDENADWIVVDKPAPLVVHPSGAKDESTLLGGLQALLACELVDGGGLSILTRLDRETSGLVLVAKHREAAGLLAKQFQRGQVIKEYTALVHGWPEWNGVSCGEPILRAAEVRAEEIWVRQQVDPGGKACATDFEVVDRFEREEGRFSMIRCFPRTGRMHQIRVHLEHLGHPIVGDKIYGSDGTPYLEQFRGALSESSVRRLILPRHALHASSLSVLWGGRRVCWESPLSPDLARFSAGGPLENGHG
jgi:23S rRNA pseudouridine1911/1915/1917 synthase